MRRALALVFALLILGGCTRPIGDPAEPLVFGDDVVIYDGPGLAMSCDEPPTPPAQVPLPDSFAAVAVTRCLFTTKPIPGDGEWFVRTEERAEGGLSELVRALRSPSATGQPGACTMRASQPVILTLHDARGASLIPQVPLTTCREPLPEVVQAIRSLPWQQVGERKIYQVRTELEITTGCYPQYKPMVELVGGRPAAGYGPVFTGTPTALQVCRYALTNETIQTESATYRMGQLSGAKVLEGEALARFLAATEAAPSVTAPCTQPQADFAVIFEKDGPGFWVPVETGGCLRLADDMRNGLRQLTAEAVALLSA